MRHNIVSLKLKYTHGTTEYRGIFFTVLTVEQNRGTAQVSTTGTILNSKRCMLSEDKLRRISFVHDNIKFVL